MRDKFIKFLRENGIDVELFMYYTDPKNNGFKFKKYKNIQDFFDKEPCENWIRDAFKWDISEFDIQTLKELDNKWKNICKNPSKKGGLKAVPEWFSKHLFNLTKSK
jgi:hypothetical protein